MRKIVRLAVSGLALCVLALQSTVPALGAGEAISALEVCGTLRAHTAATTTASGSIRIGSRSYVIASGVVAGNGGVEVSVGRDLCVAASVGGSSGILRYLFFPMLSGDRVCGNLIRPTSAETFAMKSDFGELTLVQANPAVGDNPGMRACFAYQVDRTTGDLAATAKLPVRDNFSDREHVTRCGTVKEYVPATAVASGFITVGSLSRRIAGGTPYTGDPAGDRSDRTTVGQAMCLSATLDSVGAVVDYLTSPMPKFLMATASAYTPPSGGSPGVAILSYMSRYELRIPAALDATIDVARSTYCFATTVDGDGDIMAGTVTPCPAGGVAVGGGTPSPTPAASVSTTTTAPPTPTSTASATTVALASPTAVPSESAASLLPALALAVVLLAAAAAVLAYLFRRRAIC